VHSFIVPVGITSISVQALGGSGGGSFNSQVGGAGALLTEDLAVTPGDTYFVHVAGNGETATATSNGAGFNGGGGAPDLGGAGGGGGASDIRLATDALGARVMVAAGGGGLSASENGGSANSNGGTGGSGCSDPAATAGTVIAGGTGGGGCDGTSGTDGSLGQGGDAGGRASGDDGGGGGGGGVYGGGGGGAYGSGAGGSSVFGAGASNTVSSLGTIGATPFVTISYDVGDATAVAVTASKATITADGSSTSIITAHVTDASLTGVPGDTIVFSSTDAAQTFGPVSDNGDGTYTTLLTSSTTVHTATVTATDTTSESDPSGTVAITQTAILATTGVDPGPALGLAALLLLVGAGALAVRRRTIGI
jgi:adhesin/invasin